MPELLILRGLPASGKSTFAKQWVAEDIDNRARVNRDDLRLLLHGEATYKPEQERAVTVAEHDMTLGLLKSGRSVVVDNTNLRQRYVRNFMELAVKAGAGYEVKDFEISAEEAIERDHNRVRGGYGNIVGSEVIRDMAQRFLRKGKLPPVPEVDWKHVAGRIYEPKPGLPKAILVDIDGTVALHNGRSPYDYSRVEEDLPNEPVIHAVEAFYNDGYQVVFMSGRPDSCKYETKTWLWQHVHIGHFDGPFMRATGDERNDSVVKLELFDEHVRDRFNVVAAFDDRNRVVRAWRDIGLTTFQVQDGDF